jgi:tripartite ATP-independent transporter DctM subunit
VGWIPGGLGHANVVASIIFAGMSGSAVADASGLGVIEVNAMKEQGFDVDFAAAITAASSTIGPIIPPSIPLSCSAWREILHLRLLMAGILPGLVMGLALMIMVYYFAIKRHYPKTRFPTAGRIWSSFRAAFFPLLTPVILIGGILGASSPPRGGGGSCGLRLYPHRVVYRSLTEGHRQGHDRHGPGDGGHPLHRFGVDLYGWFW